MVMEKVLLTGEWELPATNLAATVAADQMAEPNLNFWQSFSMTLC